MEEVVASLQRIPAEAVVIQPGAAGHQNLHLFPVLVEKTFEHIAPFPKFVNFIQHEKGNIRPFFAQNQVPVRADIPIEVAFGTPEHRPGHGGLPHLAWTSHKNHLFLQVSQNLFSEIAADVFHAESILHKHAKRLQVFCAPMQNTIGS